MRKSKLFFAIFFILANDTSEVRCQCQFTRSNSNLCTIFLLTREKLHLLDSGDRISKLYVTEITLASLSMDKIPNEIGKIFPNLKKLKVFRGNLSQLTSDDLKYMPKIEDFSIYESNNLRELSTPNLFQHNKNLKRIDFRFNKNLSTIHHKTFDGLENLEFLDLKHTGCIDTEFYFNETSMREVKVKLGNYCSNSTYCYSNDNKFFDCFVRKPRKSIEEFRDECDAKEVKIIHVELYEHFEFPADNPNKIVYENLVEFSTFAGRIRRLISTDFHWMPNVETLDLSDNQIRILHSDTFEYTPKLKVFKLARNRLESIGLMTFHFMPNLQEVDLTNNKDCPVDIVLNGTELQLLNSSKVEESCKLHDVLEGCEFIEDEFSFVGTATACIYDGEIDEDHGKSWIIMKEHYGFLGAPKPVEVFVSNSENNKLPRFKSIHIKTIHITGSLRKFHISTFYETPNLRSLIISIKYFFEDLDSSEELLGYQNSLSPAPRFKIKAPSLNDVMKMNKQFPNLRSISIKDSSGCVDEKYVDDPLYLDKLLIDIEECFS